MTLDCPDWEELGWPARHPCFHASRSCLPHTVDSFSTEALSQSWKLEASQRPRESPDRQGQANG